MHAVNALKPKVAPKGGNFGGVCGVMNPAKHFESRSSRKGSPKTGTPDSVRRVRRSIGGYGTHGIVVALKTHRKHKMQPGHVSSANIMKGVNYSGSKGSCKSQDQGL